MANDIEVNIRTVLDAAGMARARSQLTADAQAAGNEVEQTLANSGRQAGEKLGDGLVDGFDTQGLGGKLSGQLSSLFSVIGPGLAGAALGLGAALADDVMAGLSNGFNSQRSSAVRAIRTGLDPGEIGALGDEAGALYARGFGEGLSEVKNAAATVEQNLRGIDAALDTGQITRYATTFEEAFGISIPEQTRLARRLIANELAPDAVAAFDLIGAAAVGFGDQMDEGLDVLNEFSPTFNALGIDGASSIALIENAIQEGLFTNIDRAGDMWLELRNRIVTSDDAREAVEALGLSFDELRANLAEGGEVGEQALQRLVQALLNIKDDGELAARAVEIFGVNLEEVSDPRHAFELIAQALALEEVSGSAEDAAQTLEEAVSEWDKFQRGVTTQAGQVGESAAQIVNRLIEIREELLGLGSINLDPVIEFVGSLAGIETVDVTPLQLFHDTMLNIATLGLPELVKGLKEASDETDNYSGLAAGAADIQARLGAEAQAATEHFMFHNDAVEETADQYRILTGSAYDAEAALQATLDAINGWADNSGEAALRRMWEEVDGLTEAFNESTLAAFDATDGWDLSTEAGRRGSAEAEVFRNRLAEVTTAMFEGEVGSIAWREAVDAGAASLRAAGEDAGLTKAQIDALIASILGIPVAQMNADGNIWERADAASLGLDTVKSKSPVNVTMNAEGNIWAQIDAASLGLSGLNGRTSTSYINTVRTTTTNQVTNVRTVRWPTTVLAGGGNVWAGEAAQQGLTTSMAAPILVNDGAGPEAATLPSGDLVRLPVGSRIHTAEDTEAMTMGSGRSGPELHVHVHAGSIIAGERALIQTIREAFESGDFDQHLTLGGH